MKYISVKETAQKWGISIQMVRRYCQTERIPGVILDDGNWCIPEDAQKPTAKNELKYLVAIKKSSFVNKLQYESLKNYHYGYYEYIQINLAYSSNRIDSNRLTRNQVQEVYRKNKIGVAFEPMKVDDLIETINHFICVKYMIDVVMEPLSIEQIKQFHYLLSYGTYADRKHKITVGEYRTESVKGAMSPKKIQGALNDLIREYESRNNDLEQILAFHVQFDQIRPFMDYNSRVGRVVMMKECLRHNLTPFIIDDKHRSEYNRGMKKWNTDPSVLLNLCTRLQNRFEALSRMCRSMQYNRPAK